MKFAFFKVYGTIYYIVGEISSQTGNENKLKTAFLVEKHGSFYKKKCSTFSLICAGGLT